MHIMISAGGTGGGVYPALAVVSALRKLYPDHLTLTFVGARGDMAFDLIDPALFDATRRGVVAGRCTAFRACSRSLSALKILVGIVQSLVLVIRQRPAGAFSDRGMGRISGGGRRAGCCAARS